MDRHPTVRRNMAVENMRRALESTGSPRLRMIVLITITGGVGFLTSFGLLHAGLDTMVWRYLAAMVLAYGAFLGMVGLWVRFYCPAQRNARQSDWEDVSDLCDLNIGGQDSGSGLDAMDILGGADEGAIPLAIVAAIVAAVALVFVGVIWWAVAAAPMLFAELMVDALLSAGLYRQLHGIVPQHWFATTLRRTGFQFAVALVLVTISAMLMSAYAPEAHSIGQFVSAVLASLDAS